MLLSTPILIAIDIYSEYNRILKRALNIAKHPDLCHLIFVTLPLHELQPYLNKLDYRLIEANETQGKLRLKEIASQFCIPANNIHVLKGDVVDTICNIANNINASLIVIGSHGRAGMKPILGSNANRVLQEAKRDILTVRLSGDEDD